MDHLYTLPVIDGDSRCFAGLGVNLCKRHRSVDGNLAARVWPEAGTVEHYPPLLRTLHHQIFSLPHLDLRMVSQMQSCIGAVCCFNL